MKPKKSWRVSRKNLNIDKKWKIFWDGERARVWWRWFSFSIQMLSWHTSSRRVPTLLNIKISTIFKTWVRYSTVFYAVCLFVFVATAPQWAKASLFTRFLYHTQWCTTVGRTPLCEWLARRRDLYLTTYNTNNRQISMPPAGFEPSVSAGERPRTYALDRAATGTCIICCSIVYYRRNHHI